MCLAATKKEKWVKDNQGQMIITAGQIVWTHECEKALADEENARRAVKALKKKWIRCVWMEACACMCGEEEMGSAVTRTGEG